MKGRNFDPRRTSLAHSLSRLPIADDDMALGEIQALNPRPQYSISLKPLAFEQWSLLDSGSEIVYDYDS